MDDKVYLNKPTLVMMLQPNCKVQVFDVSQEKY